MRNVAILPLVCLLVPLLGACVAGPPGMARFQGRTVVVHLGDVSACREGSRACNIRRLNAAGENFEIYAQDSEGLAHELEHVFGGLKTAPVRRVGDRYCEYVMDAGTTFWKAGHDICGGDHGGFISR